ncbi:DUF488 domain-containing protein [Nonomuraea sp. NPDC026600]|uniref:DUF488 domain-containing protein n=1 Tax=Nonomuraea sp. NPDC026600 TaxID=3155363 RepID=UPI0033D671B3
MVTIGVYGFGGESFLQRLRHADVRLLLDVRQRRGAPTTELRRLQYAEDDRQGVGRRSRRELAAEYTRRYTTEILDHADLTPIVSELPSSGTAALLCVERDPEACHRSLLAQRLTEQHHVTIEHLRPWTTVIDFSQDDPEIRERHCPAAAGPSSAAGHLIGSSTVTA